MIEDERPSYTFYSEPTSPTGAVCETCGSVFEGLSYEEYSDGSWLFNISWGCYGGVHCESDDYNDLQDARDVLIQVLNDWADEFDVTELREHLEKQQALDEAFQFRDWDTVERLMNDD